MLVLEWVPPREPWDDLLHFIFDGGVLSQEQVAEVHISDGELSEFAMCTEQEAAERLRGDLWARLSRVLDALKDVQSIYREHQAHPRDASE